MFSRLPPPAPGPMIEAMTETITRRTSQGTAQFHLALAVALLIALVSRLSFLGEPFKNDSGIYIYLGKVLWQGGRLYHDFWETKLPTVPLIMAPIYALFQNHWMPYVLLQAAMGVGGAWILAAALRRFVGPWTFEPALLFGLIGLNLSRLTITGFQLETVQMFFEILSAAMVLRSLKRAGNFDALLAGLLAGVAAMPKPTGLAVAGAAAVAYCWDARRLGIRPTVMRLAALAGGAGIVVVAATVWVIASPMKSEMPFLLRQIQLYASGTPWRSLLQFKTWIFFVIPFVPLVVRGLLTRREPAALGSVVVFAILWEALEIAAVVVQRRVYGYHFLVLMPPAVVLFAMWPRSGGVWPSFAAVTPLALLSLYFSVPGYLALRNADPMPVSRFVRAHCDATDTVWGDPSPRLLLETGLAPGARFPWTFFFVNHDAAPREFADILLDDLQARRPKYIVLPIQWQSETQQRAADTPGLEWRPVRRQAYLKARAEVFQYIQSHYKLETQLDGMLAYRRLAH